jgi:nitrogen fixation NifU-like protein
MMTEAVKGRDLASAQQLQQHFRAVLTSTQEPDAATLGKLVSLSSVRRYPSRIKCALLGWHALMHAIAEHANDAADPTATPPEQQP